MIQAQTTQLINTNKLKQFIGFPVVTFATRWTYGPSAAHENGSTLVDCSQVSEVLL